MSSNPNNNNNHAKEYTHKGNIYTEGTHTEESETYTGRGRTHGGRNTEETYIWSEIYTEGTCPRKDIDTEGYIHGGTVKQRNIHTKGTYTQRGHTYTRRGHVEGGTYTRRNIYMDAIYK